MMIGKRHKSRGLLLIPVVLALAITACGSDDGRGSGGSGTPTIVTTTTILGDVVQNIVDEEAEVIVLMPVGADPHDFQASAAQVAAINDSDLVVANGLGLEEGLDDVLDAAAGDGVRVLRVAPLLDPIPFGGVSAGDHEESHEQKAGDGHDGDDPHVWFDPLRMGTAARLIAGELIEITPAVDWMEGAEAYVAELAAADKTITETLAPVPSDRRRLITNHESFGYFAARYDFTVVGTVIPAGSTLANPSSEELADLVGLMEREDVNVIFAETTQSTALAEAVAAELGEEVEVVALLTGSLDEPGSAADTLIGMLQTNATRIATALSG